MNLKRFLRHIIKGGKNDAGLRRSERGLLVALCLLIALPWSLFFAPRLEARRPELPQPMRLPQMQKPGQRPDTIPSDSTVMVDAELLVKAEGDSIPPTVVQADDYPYGLDGKIPFNPSPTRAIWLSALFPGLGQIYNRRYWKLPIIIGGFMGLGYATSWNNNQYQDYMQGYRDLLDSDPNTKSYMNFFPPTISEGDLDQEWLKNIFKQRKDYYRRNRDLCIISIVAVYLLCIVDAYIDASMAHFDISPNLSMDVAPAMMVSPSPTGRKAALGLNWALTF